MKAVPLFKTACRWLSVAMVVPVLAAQAATVPLFTNNGTLNYGNNPPPPLIDATAVLNRGLIDAGFFSPYPFETSNTRFFTNDFSGVMQGSPGFRFEFYTNGNRFQSEAFVNRGLINCGTHILVNSKRVASTNGALLQVGNSGLVKLTGGDVDLSRGGVSAGGGPQAQSRGFDLTGNRYFNGSSVTDLYWGAGANNRLAAGGPLLALNGIFDLNPPFFNLVSPSHQVIFPPNTTNLITVPQFGAFKSYTAHVLSNDVSPTSQFIQVVFVPVDTDTNVLSTSVRFFPGGAASTAIIGFESPSIDIITGDPFTNSVFVLDSTASVTTNSILATNIGVNPRTFRPLAHEITRAVPFEWLFGVSTNAPYDNDLLDSPLYASTSVPVDYYGYRAQVGQTLLVAGTGTQDPSNSLGRVEIRGNNVNLTQARIAAESFISIQASNVIGGGNFAIDAPFINMNLQSTNEVLQLDAVGPGSVRRLSGQVSLWSAYWTNTLDDGNGGTILREFAVTVVNPELNVVQPIQFGDFQVTANQIILGDQLNLPEDAVFNASCLTIASNAVLNFSGSLGVAQLPILMCFTNHGVISAFNFASFGPDQAAPLTDFVNTGFITAGTIAIDTGTFANSGDPLTGIGGTLQSSVGPLMARFNTGTVTDSQFIALGAVGSVELTGTSLLISNTTLRADAALRLNITGTLSDGGTTSGNIWSVRRGFEFLTQPAMGGLLGTTITSAPPNFVLSEHIFCGNDLGATNAGYTNNATIGVLSLRGALFNTFLFRGNAPGKALYVDFLDLQGSATNFLDTLLIEEGTVVYFADSNLPAEKLDGAFGGRLRWVSTYAGAFSSITVPLSGGGTITVNRALRNNSAIDSDADGIPNAFDPFPFDPPFVQVSIVQAPSFAGGEPQQLAQISWQAAANTMYRVECRTSLDGPWQFLTNYTHGSKNGLATVTDPINEAGICFYRVVYFK